MDFTKLTVKAQEAVAGAQERARARGNPEVTPDHLLIALLADRDSVAETLLRSAGAEVEALRRGAEAKLADLPSVTGQTLSNPQASLGFRTALDRAEQEAGELGDQFTATEHLLLGLVETPGPVRDRLRQANITKDALLAALRDLRGGQ